MEIFSSVQFSYSVMSNSLQPHRLQHSRPPCPISTPSPLKLVSIESVMTSSHLILCTCLWTGEPGTLGRNTSLCKISGHREPVSWLMSLSPWTKQVHDIVKARERGDTRLQKEKVVRLQGPSSNFVEAIKEQRKQVSKAWEL